MTSLKIILSGFAMLGVIACNQNPNQTKLQYMPDMADNPTVKAQEGYLDPPEHSVAMNAILYPKTVEEAEQLLRNPYPNSDEVLSKGKDLYETFCTACHGSNGAGGGGVTSYFEGIPNIAGDLYRNRQDGFFFYRITFGKGRMPGYGHAISPNERWYIIHHLRTLQKAG
jgi:mono/diheme cytochrome c family protein